MHDNHTIDAWPEAAAVVTGLSFPQTEPELWERQLIEPALVKILDQPAERPEVGDAADE